MCRVKAALGDEEGRTIGRHVAQLDREVCDVCRGGYEKNGARLARDFDISFQRCRGEREGVSLIGTLVSGQTCSAGELADHVAAGGDSDIGLVPVVVASVLGGGEMFGAENSIPMKVHRRLLGAGEWPFFLQAERAFVLRLHPGRRRELANEDRDRWFLLDAVVDSLQPAITI